MPVYRVRAEALEETVRRLERKGETVVRTTTDPERHLIFVHTEHKVETR